MTGIKAVASCAISASLCLAAFPKPSVCPLTHVEPTTTQLSDYTPYNLGLAHTTLEFDLTFSHVRVQSTLAVRRYDGGDILLNGAEGLQLEAITLLYNVTHDEVRYTYKRDLLKSVCLNANNTLIIPERSVPSNHPLRRLQRLMLGNEGVDDNGDNGDSLNDDYYEHGGQIELEEFTGATADGERDELVRIENLDLDGSTPSTIGRENGEPPVGGFAAQPKNPHPTEEDIRSHPKNFGEQESGSPLGDSLGARAPEVVDGPHHHRPQPSLFTLQVVTHLNPSANTALFGLYKSRNLLVTQNEAFGFRRISFYPDRPDVLAPFTVIARSDPSVLPIILSNGDLASEKIIDKSMQQSTVIFEAPERGGDSESDSEPEDSDNTVDDKARRPRKPVDEFAVSDPLANARIVKQVRWEDPHPKPSYLFALVAGDLIRVEKRFVVGMPCEVVLEALVGEANVKNHPLAYFCDRVNTDDITRIELLRKSRGEAARGETASIPNSRIRTPEEADGSEIDQQSRHLLEERMRGGNFGEERIIDINDFDDTKDLARDDYQRRLQRHQNNENNGNNSNNENNENNEIDEEMRNFASHGNNRKSSESSSERSPESLIFHSATARSVIDLDGVIVDGAGLTKSEEASEFEGERIDPEAPATMGETEVVINRIPASKEDGDPSWSASNMFNVLAGLFDDTRSMRDLDFLTQAKALLARARAPWTGQSGRDLQTAKAPLPPLPPLPPLAPPGANLPVADGRPSNRWNFKIPVVSFDNVGDFASSLVSQISSAAFPGSAGASTVSAEDRVYETDHAHPVVTHLLNVRSAPLDDKVPVSVRVWAERGTVKSPNELQWALESIIAAMRYDEIRWGLPYDLHEFNLVAVQDFNAGAMENKGLNIFNEVLVKSDPSWATDAQYERIRGVVAHEYFHNWSGDRVTVRDWFQLTLKEGFTVFRDQEFTNDLLYITAPPHTPSANTPSANTPSDTDRPSNTNTNASASSDGTENKRRVLELGVRSVKRLDDIDMMETAQFAQDAGALSHAVRPGEYQTIENFYTVTVYEKGAEIVRLYETLLGRELMRRVTDAFFIDNQHKSATCEDFIAAAEKVTAKNFTQFARWYSTPGTPLIQVRDVQYRARTVRISIEQRTSTGKPLVVPIRVSLIDPLSHKTMVDNALLVLDHATQTFEFRNIPTRPVVSLLRGLSAPVKIAPFLPDTDLAYLAIHETRDWYTKSKAATELQINYLKSLLAKLNPHITSATLATADTPPSLTPHTPDTPDTGDHTLAGPFAAPTGSLTPGQVEALVGPAFPAPLQAYIDRLINDSHRLALAVHAANRNKTDTPTHTNAHTHTHAHAGSDPAASDGSDAILVSDDVDDQVVDDQVVDDQVVAARRIPAPASPPTPAPESNLMALNAHLLVFSSARKLQLEQATFDPLRNQAVAHALRKTVCHRWHRQLMGIYNALERAETFANTCVRINGEIVVGCAQSAQTPARTALPGEFEDDEDQPFDEQPFDANISTPTLRSPPNGSGSPSIATGPLDISPERTSRRALKNAVLRLLVHSDEGVSLAIRQLANAKQANDVSAALFALASTTNRTDVQLLLATWLRENLTNDTLVDRWLAAQMSWPDIRCANRFELLIESQLYAGSRNPNRLRALARSFASNAVAFHQRRGYKLVADEILRWDAFNPKLAAGLANAFAEVNQVIEPLRAAAKIELTRIIDTPDVSHNLREIVQRILHNLQTGTAPRV